MIAVRRCLSSGVPGIDFVELSRVTAGYDRRPTLRSVSARFDAGTVTCIEGPNGAGKSTLLAVLGTVLAPTAGQVVYGPDRLSREAARRQIGWLSHEGRLYRELTGRENVELVARLRDAASTSRVSEVLSRLGVGEFAERVVRTLSRGQKQRIALCCALVHEPSVLLLDEPLTGLDSEAAARLVEILRDAAGRVTVIVNHAPGFSERVNGVRLVLAGGRLSPGT